MVSPGLRLSKLGCMISSSHRPDGLAAARTDHLARLIEEDVVVHHEQPLTLDEFVECPGLQGDDVAWTGGNVVAPGLTGIDRPRRAHPVVGGRAGKHEENVD